MLGQIPHKERIKRSDYQWEFDERVEKHLMRKEMRVLKKLKEKEYENCEES